MALTNIVKNAAATLANIVKQTINSFLLKQDGDYLLLQTGDKIILQQTDAITNVTKTAA